MAEKSKEIVLITGANGGLGLEIARLILKQHGDRFHVLIGCRTLSKGEATVKELQGQGLSGCEVLEINVSDDDSISKAAKEVEQKFGRLDVLHINAGICIDLDGSSKNKSISQKIIETTTTNVAGAAQTLETFAPLLDKSSNPRVIFISSTTGSLSSQASWGVVDPWPAYSASKASLNSLLIYYTNLHKGWRVNAMCPGFMATNLNNFGGDAPGSQPGTTADGAVNALRLTLLSKDGETGTFTKRDNETGDINALPW